MSFRTFATALGLVAVLSVVGLILSLAEQRREQARRSTIKWAFGAMRDPPGQWDESQQSALRMMLTHPELLSCRGRGGETPLMLAAFSGNADVVEDLLVRGEDPLVEGLPGLSALFWTGASGNPKIARLLLDRGAKVDRENADGSTPLLYASHYGHAEMATLLLGADPNHRDRQGNTPLLIIADRGGAREEDALAVARALLKAGADPISKIGAATLRSAARRPPASKRWRGSYGPQGDAEHPRRLRLYYRLSIAPRSSSAQDASGGESGGVAPRE